LNTIGNITTEELISKYSDTVFRVAYARTQNVEDAKDITQDVYLKFIKANEKINDEEHVKAWLLKVAVNTGNTFVTSAWARHRAELNEAADETGFMEEKSEVFYAVKDLPEKYRVIVHLFYYEEMSMKEICSILKLSETAVKSRLHRARTMLKEKLKEADYEF